MVFKERDSIHKNHKTSWNVTLVNLGDLLYSRKKWPWVLLQSRSFQIWYLVIEGMSIMLFWNLDPVSPYRQVIITFYLSLACDIPVTGFKSPLLLKLILRLNFILDFLVNQARLAGISRASSWKLPQQYFCWMLLTQGSTT